MGSPSARRITRADYHFLLRFLTNLDHKLKASGRKSIYRFMDPKVALAALYDLFETYIVEEQFLVAYTLGTPWYCPQGTVMLNEELVVGLAASGDFSVVPSFLEAKAREAGAVLALAGTALARTDNALASLYHRAGYSTQAITLVKET